MLRLSLAILLLLGLPAHASESVVAGLSQNRVAITATFVGSEILIFGAIKRDAPPPTDNPVQVIVVVEGPSHPLVVRQKSKHFGIWINADSANITAAPSFYAVATSAPFAQVISDSQDLLHHISIPRSIQTRATDSTPTGTMANFREAVIRIRTNQGLYHMAEGGVTLTQDTLFSVAVQLPANLTEGDYLARIYLTRAGKVVAQHTASIQVQKVGLERWIYALAHEKPLIYGMLSIFIAIASGWAASALFRVLIRT